jgi:hypothetical protein
MFNLRKAQRIQEKYMRDDNLGPKADDDQPITEKVLPHREGHKYTILEEWLQDRHENEAKEAHLLEKVFTERKGYIDHRHAEDGLSVPSINDVVARLEVERREAWKTEKDPHWSQTNKRNQNGELPAWPKVAPQHDKIVLNNDPRRFKGDSTAPLIGGITMASLQGVADMIKNGQAADYDIAMTAILKDADQDKRELTEIEQTTIHDLKIARTKSLLKEYAKGNQ